MAVETGRAYIVGNFAAIADPAHLDVDSLLKGALDRLEASRPGARRVSEPRLVRTATDRIEYEADFEIEEP